MTTTLRALLLLLLLVGCRGTGPLAEAEPATVRVMTYNIVGMSAERLSGLIAAADVGIVALQEIGSGKNLDLAAERLGPQWSAVYPGCDTPHLVQPPGRSARFWIGGHHMPAALITRYEVVDHRFFNITDTPDDWLDARRIECYRSSMLVRLKVAQHTFVNVFSLHGNPWNSAWRVREFADVLRQLDGYHRDDPTIVLGDFNAVSHLDGPDDPNDAAATRQLAEAGFVDTFRAANPDVAKHPGRTNESGRIDQIHVRNGGGVLQSFVVREPRWGLRDRDSDHQPLFSELRLR